MVLWVAFYSYAFMWSTGEIQNRLYIVSNFLHIRTYVGWLSCSAGDHPKTLVKSLTVATVFTRYLPMHIQCVTVCSLMFVSVVPALLCHIKHLVQHCPHL